jgi:signal transduction histidine kinase
MHGLTSHEPLLANLLGHFAGAAAFGIFLALMWRSGTGLRSGRITFAAAGLAFFWNAASLALLAAPEHAPGWLAPAAMGSLSLLPALLLDLGLGGRPRAAVLAGYGLAGAAVLLHVLESRLPALPIHRQALLLTAGGFALLTLAAWFPERQRGRGRLAALAVVLFSLTFAHFHDEGAHTAWPLELAMHHAGIPLCLFVLAQDYRFLLLDAYLRFLANLCLAGAFTFAGWKAAAAAGWTAAGALEDPRQMALAAAAGCGWLALYGVTRSPLQRALTRLVFRRAPLEAALGKLRSARVESEEAYLEMAAEVIAGHFQAGSRAWLSGAEAGGPDEAVVRLAGERNLRLGRRAGGRRYLSEDRTALERLAAAARERLEQFRESEMARLLSQAELRALQAQIHPHFLFNALNALYGAIPREAAGARQTVLNLADILRYFLRSGEALIPLEEELAIVRAYLEIEQLRLGPKLRATFRIDPEAPRVPVPVLTLEPLVENAVKHGVAALPEGGEVRVEAAIEGRELRVRVTDTGPGFAPAARDGVGLENVRRRLALCLGESARLEIERRDGATCAGFRVPLPSSAQP